MESHFQSFCFNFEGTFVTQGLERNSLEDENIYFEDEQWFYSSLYNSSQQLQWDKISLSLSISLVVNGWRDG